MKKEKPISFDFQGWGMYPIRIKDLIKALTELGVLDEDGGVTIVETMSDAYENGTVVTVEDDGMGYGVDEMPVISVSADTEHNRLILFREKPLDNIDMWMEDGVHPGMEVTVLGKKGYVVSLSNVGGVMCYLVDFPLGEYPNKLNLLVTRRDMREAVKQTYGDNGDGGRNE